jgi:hypothetical protein
MKYYKVLNSNANALLNKINNAWKIETGLFNYVYTYSTEINDFSYIFADDITDKYTNTGDYIEIVSELPPLHQWHDESCGIQIYQTYDDSLAMLEEHPDVATYRKENNIETIREFGFVYVYVNWLLPEHRALFESYNATINERPT